MISNKTEGRISSFTWRKQVLVWKKCSKLKLWQITKIH